MVHMFQNVFIFIIFWTTVKSVIGKPVDRTKMIRKLTGYVEHGGFQSPAATELRTHPEEPDFWDQEPTPIMQREHEIEEAAGSGQKLQRVTNLLIKSKTVDEENLKMIKQKRCGTNNFYTGKRTKRYTLKGRSWNSKNLTYTVKNFPSYLSRDEVESTIKKALQMWSNASQLTFTQVTAQGAKADINIKFVTGFHGDGHPTDGPGMELAHAFSPLNNTGLAGDVHFDVDETFTVHGGDGVDLLWVTVHELGHSLGLEHTYHPDSVMFPYYKGYTPHLQLNSDDMEGIQHLYGPPNSVTLTSPYSSVSPDSVPNVCSVKRIDAAVRTTDRNNYIFSGAYFWELRRSGVSRALRIKEHWAGLEDNIDAALTRRKNGKTYFFKGSKFWIFNNKASIEGPLNITQLNLPTELTNMDAALHPPGTDHAFFFKGNKYWRYNWANESIDQGYPQIIGNVSWKRIPADMDAAFQWHKGRVYVIKGGDYYALKHQWNRGVKKGFPKRFITRWLGCSDVKNIRKS